MKIFVVLFVLFCTVRGQTEKSTKPGHFPNSVQIFNGRQTEDSRKVCNGAVIDKNWVLTAASCVQSKHVYVVAGNEKAGNGREASKVIPHERYKDGEVKFDLALIWFRIPLELGFEINKVALPSQLLDVPKVGSGCKVAVSEKSLERNQVTSDTTRGNDSSQLKHLNVRIIEESECGDTFRTDHNLCVENNKEQEINSGSPLVCENSEKQKVLYGILTNARENENLLAVRVSTFKEWIEKTKVDVVDDYNRQRTKIAILLGDFIGLFCVVYSQYYQEDK